MEMLCWNLLACSVHSEVSYVAKAYCSGWTSVTESYAHMHFVPRFRVDLGLILLRTEVAELLAPFFGRPMIYYQEDRRTERNARAESHCGGRACASIAY